MPREGKRKRFEGGQAPRRALKLVYFIEHGVRQRVGGVKDRCKREGTKPISPESPRVQCDEELLSSWWIKTLRTCSLKITGKHVNGHDTTTFFPWPEKAAKR